MNISHYLNIITVTSFGISLRSSGIRTMENDHRTGKSVPAGRGICSIAHGIFIYPKSCFLCCYPGLKCMLKSFSSSAEYNYPFVFISSCFFFFFFFFLIEDFWFQEFLSAFFGSRNFCENGSRNFFVKIMSCRIFPLKIFCFRNFFPMSPGFSPAEMFTPGTSVVRISAPETFPENFRTVSIDPHYCH